MKEGRLFFKSSREKTLKDLQGEQTLYCQNEPAAHIRHASRMRRNCAHWPKSPELVMCYAEHLKRPAAEPSK